MHEPRAAVSAASCCCCCCCCCEEEEEEEEEELEGSLLLLFPPPPPPARSSLTSNSSGQFFPVMNSRARRAPSGGAEASLLPSSTAMPFRTSICPCGLLEDENGAEAAAAAASALGRRSGAKTHPTTFPEPGSTRATQGVPQMLAQSSPSAREASPTGFGFVPLPLPPPRPKSEEEGGGFAAALSVSFEASAEAAPEAPEAPEASSDLTALAGTHSSSFRLKTSTRFLFFLPSPFSTSSPSSVTVTDRSAFETFHASANTILDEPSERATAEAEGTKAAPQPSPRGVRVSSGKEGEAEELVFFAAAAPVLRCRASSMAPPSASAGFFGASLLSEEGEEEDSKASASCQKALPESHVSWRSLDPEEEEEDEEEEVEFFEEGGTFVSPSPKASSGSLAVCRALPDSRSTSLTVDLPLRPVKIRKWRGERGSEKRPREEDKEKERDEERKKEKRFPDLSTPRGRPCTRRRLPRSPRAAPSRSGRTRGPG